MHVLGSYNCQVSAFVTLRMLISKSSCHQCFHTWFTVCLFYSIVFSDWLIQQGQDQKILLSQKLLIDLINFVSFHSYLSCCVHIYNFLSRCLFQVFLHATQAGMQLSFFWHLMCLWVLDSDSVPNNNTMPRIYALCCRLYPNQ